MHSVAAELGAVVFFEHVNLRVPDHGLATAFFLEGLGLTRDPYRMVGTRNMWVNVGQQQFHLPIGEPEPFPGEIGVVVPALDEVEARLQILAPAFAGTGYSLAREGATLATTTPWGHRLRVHPAGQLPGPRPQALAYAEFWVAPDTANAIGAFYREVLGCPVQVARFGSDPGVRVHVGPYQVFHFRERAGGGAVDRTNHVAVYLTRYHAVYAALEKRGLILEADAAEQFRFRDMVAPDAETVVYGFEHEMRSLHHPDYRRPLVNRVAVPYRVD